MGMGTGGSEQVLPGEQSAVVVFRPTSFVSQSEQLPSRRGRLGNGTPDSCGRGRGRVCGRGRGWGGQTKPS